MRFCWKRDSWRLNSSLALAVWFSAFRRALFWTSSSSCASSWFLATRSPSSTSRRMTRLAVRAMARTSCSASSELEVVKTRSMGPRAISVTSTRTAGGLRSSDFFGDGDHGNFEQPVQRPTHSAKIAMKKSPRRGKFPDRFFHRITRLFSAEMGFNLLDNSGFITLFGAFAGDGARQTARANIA